MAKIFLEIREKNLCKMYITVNSLLNDILSLSSRPVTFSLSLEDMAHHNFILHLFFFIVWGNKVNLEIML